MSRRLLGYLYRTFHEFNNPDVILTLYKTQVFPILDYACVVWDPYLKKDCKLDVQVFFMRIASGLWRCGLTSMTGKFNLPSLVNGRIYFKLLTAYKLLLGLSHCPVGFFLFYSEFKSF